MELTHAFTVPTPVDATWEHFQDIGALAECFPGAQVTSVGETEDGAPEFTGTCKVKLGPIALVYTGSGTFVERDEAGRRFVIEAKGRDKRGNGTAGATVTLTMQPDGSGTAVEVVTDLAVTGKPAQFGRGMMQDVSDKLLGQFVACLEERLGADAEPASEPVAEPVPEPVSQPASEPPSGPTGAAAAGAPRVDRDAQARSDDALDLGATVVPVLVKAYGKQVALVVFGLIGLVMVVRLLRRR